MPKHSKGPRGHPSVPLKEARCLGLHGLSALLHSGSHRDCAARSAGSSNFVSVLVL